MARGEGADTGHGQLKEAPYTPQDQSKVEGGRETKLVENGGNWHWAVDETIGGGAAKLSCWIASEGLVELVLPWIYSDEAR
jgi:hypothetical protein